MYKYTDAAPNTYRRGYGDAHLQTVYHDDARRSFVLLDGECIGEVAKGYPTFQATRYADGEVRRFDAEQDWDLTKTVLPWVAGRPLARPSRHTDCGYEWPNLNGSCPICNGGGHYHYADGGCDTEPCYRHGGPA